METTTQHVESRGAYATPVSDEVERFDLPVEGALPAELFGSYVRNGPNPRVGSPAGHLFTGDGMLHGLRLEGGRARWYRNRWVRTDSFVRGTPYVRPNGTLDFRAGPANTNLIAHAGRMLALVESSFPYEVDGRLQTRGPYDFAGALKTPFTAHPKRCPRTGELHAFGMCVLPGGLTYHRIDAAGTLLESRPIATAGVTMMHDFALTERYAIFMDLPIVFDFALAVKGAMPYRWSDSYGARLGIVSREDASAPVRWHAVEPCYVFHVLNAFEAGPKIVLDVVRYRELWRDGSNGFAPTTLHRWTIDVSSGTVDETTLDERPVEFPRCDERRAGGAYRYGYAVGTAYGESRTLCKYDLVTGSRTEHDFGAGRIPGEAVFVPASDAEDGGWLMCFVYDVGRDRSDFVVLDASDLRAKPVASVALPQRVPLGFHGNWIDDAAAVALQ